MFGKRIRQKFREGGVAIGSWITFRDPAVAEIMARAGFDWLTVDMEHSPITLSEAQELIRVISLCDVCPLVRMPANDPTLAKRLMDAGAAGIIVPMVNSAADAELAVQSVKYPPLGRRSVGLARAQGYGPGFDDYVGTTNEDSLVIVQIEHADAVANIDQILAVPGVDAFFIGPYDLSASMGLPGRFGDRRIQDALNAVIRAGQRQNVPAGIHVVYPSRELMLEKTNQGFQFLAYGVDFLLLGETCRHDLVAVKSLIQERAGRITDGSNTA
jgi:2-dehydro-3-deoxyglucarate aldolase